jgi:hypothetical protein
MWAIKPIRLSAAHFGAHMARRRQLGAGVDWHVNMRVEDKLLRTGSSERGSGC